MAVKVATVFAIALSSLLLSVVVSAGNAEMFEKTCSVTQYPGDCKLVTEKYVDSAQPTHGDILLGGIKLINDRAKDGIEQIKKLRASATGVEASKLGMVEAYYKMIVTGSKNAKVAFEGADWGSLEFELDGAVKTIYECQDMVPKDSPLHELNYQIHRAAKNNLGFANMVAAQ